MLPLKWRKLAVRDLARIAAYIAKDNPEAAEKLKAEIEAKVEMLRLHVQMGRRGRVSGTRELVVRPNYLVVYADDAAVVRVLRILHAAQQWPPPE